MRRFEYFKKILHSVLNLSKNELLRRTDLEEETIDDVMNVFAAEFED